MPQGQENRPGRLCLKQAGIFFDLFSPFWYEDAPLTRPGTGTGMNLDAVFNRLRGIFFTVKKAKLSNEKAKKETKDAVDFYDWFDFLEFKIKPKDKKSLPNGSGK